MSAGHLAALALSFLLAGPTYAFKPGDDASPAILFVSVPEALRGAVRSHRLLVDCRSAEQSKTCELTATLTLTLGIAEPAELPLQLSIGHNAQVIDLGAEVDGTPVEASRLQDPALAGLELSAGNVDAAHAMRWASAVSLPLGPREVEVRVRATLQLEHRRYTSWNVSPIDGRHLAFGSRPLAEQHFDIWYRTPFWMDEHVDVEAHVPVAWKVGGSEALGRGHSQPRPEVLSHDRSVPLTFVPRSLVLIRPAGVLTLGGPQVAVGYGFGAARGARVRLGYQLAAPERFLHSLSVETDLRGRWTVTPLSQVASDWYLIVPSVGFGVGVPVQVAPEVRPGVRVLADAHLGPLGLVINVDAYPALRSNQTVQWQFMVGPQLAL